jgi:hypothetical protein
VYQIKSCKSNDLQSRRVGVKADPSPLRVRVLRQPVISGPYYGGLNFELLGIQMAVF